MHTPRILCPPATRFLLLCTHLTGVLGRAVLPDLPVGDLVMPSLTVELLSPFWAGVFVAGPLAAIMSTVDSMLLLVSASIVKDLYIRYRLKGDVSRIPARRVSRMSLGCTLATGFVVFLAAFKPPDLLVWINLFAFGGLEAVFLWPIVLGLYWKKANAAGAVLAMLGGAAAFILLTAGKISILGLHAIVPTLVFSFALFVLGSLVGRPASAEVVKLFWKEA